MAEETEQLKFWKGSFGREYTDRNTKNQEEWEQSYLKKYGKTKTELNEEFIGHLPQDIKILEVGCNTGQQLESFQKQGFKDLYGIEIQWYAVEKAKSLLREINIIQASAYDIPFKNGFFDLVCTHGVLIHIGPKDLPKAMDEIYRCSNKYIMGLEYFSETMTEINYRGHQGYLWKADYAEIFLERYPDLTLVKKEFLPYISEEESKSDCMYLLEKV